VTATQNRAPRKVAEEMHSSHLPDNNLTLAPSSRDLSDPNRHAIISRLSVAAIESEV
jgi:hypothetical protein